MHRDKTSEFYRQYKDVEDLGGFDQSFPATVVNDLAYETHPQAIYTSRLLDFKNLPEPQNSKEVNEQFYDGLT